MISEMRIQKFGFPDYINTQDYELSFDNTLSDKKFVGPECYCKKDEAKFFIFRKADKKSIFTMEFYIRDADKRSNAFGRTMIKERNMRLQHISTLAEYRKKGIATFYMKQLITLCLENDIHVLTLDIAPGTKDTTNALNRDGLKNFYKSFETDDISIVFI